MTRAESLAEFDRQLLVSALAQHITVKRTAIALGVTRPYFYKLCERRGIALKDSKPQRLAARWPKGL